MHTMISVDYNERCVSTEVRQTAAHTS